LDIQVCAGSLRYYADLAVNAQYTTPMPVAGHEARIERLPYGPCGFIFPWNFPFWLMGWGIAPALAAGNTIVIKPAEDTPLSTLYLCRLVEEAEIPAGVVNVVAGYGEPAGASLARHTGIKRMSFTGSPEVGKSVGEACGRNLVPVKLELGGKGAAVVFDDVDIDDTAQKLCQAITFHSGQLCCDATRWLVHDSVYDGFLGAVRDKMESVQVGHGFDAQAQMGPVVSDKQRRRILSYLERGQAEGADALLPGGVCTVDGCEGGFYVKPALLGGSLDNVAAREEIFGPVAYVTRFTDEADAIRLANHTSYGLANSVWSTDLDRCDRVARRMVAGTSWVNAHNTFPQGVPFSGVNLSGFGGGVNSAQTFYDYLRDLAVVRPNG
jgi:aldehyde dehydrogenase (NAD+)